MNNYARETIKSRLNKIEKRQLTINLPALTIAHFDKLIATFSELNNVVYTRNAFLEDAINSYIEELENYLKEQKDTISIPKHEKEIPQETFYDMAIYPGFLDGFQEEFINNKRWFPVRIQKDRISKIKYIAIYIGRPISAITHYAIVDKYIPCENNPNKYTILLKDIHKLNKSIKLGNISPVATRSPKYTTIDKFLHATTFKDL